MNTNFYYKIIEETMKSELNDDYKFNILSHLFFALMYSNHDVYSDKACINLQELIVKYQEEISKKNEREFFE